MTEVISIEDSSNWIDVIANTTIDRVVWDDDAQCDVDLVEAGLIHEDETLPRMNDALVIGDLDSPESQAVLNSQLITGYSNRAPKVAGDQWVRGAMPVRNYLDQFTSHPVQEKKEGSAFFFNETVLTGRSNTYNGETATFTHRSKKFAKSVTAFVVDIDGTDTVNRMVTKIQELGLFAIIYTTHSQAKKATPDGDYFRAIIPLEKPFAVSETVSALYASAVAVISIGPKPNMNDGIPATISSPAGSMSTAYSLCLPMMMSPVMSTFMFTS